uniref:Uncharacterized protein n=1 Tax=Lepeophtheirus salmonis TaxID=72036 RepID=A0A0K2VGW5_LEPSM
MRLEREQRLSFRTLLDGWCFTHHCLRRSKSEILGKKKALSKRPNCTEEGSLKKAKLYLEDLGKNSPGQSPQVHEDPLATFDNNNERNTTLLAS